MSVEQITYLDSSAIVKLAIEEPESLALRQFLRRRRPYVSSALARTEVARALLPLGSSAIQRGERALQSIDLIRLNTRILNTAGRLLPMELRSLDAIHLATALELGGSLARMVTYDQRLGLAGLRLGWSIEAPR
jgi:hypothetical protein